MHVSSETVNTHFNIHAQLLNFADLFALRQYPPINVYVSCLSNAMAAVLGLSVHGGVPV